MPAISSGYKDILINEVIEEASIGIVLYDAEKNCIQKNKMFGHLLDLPERFMNRNFKFDELVHFCYERGDFGKELTYEEVIYFYTSRIAEHDELCLEMTLSNGQWLAVRYTPLSHHYFMFIYKDITLRKKHEEESRRYASIFQSIEDAIVTKNLSGEITSWNHGAQRLFGYSEEEVIGKHVSILFPMDQNLTEAETILKDVCLGKKIKAFDAIRIKKDGAHIHVSVSIAPIYDSVGKVVGACKIVRDIQEHIHTKNELELAQQVFLSANEAIMVCDEENKVVSVNPAFSKLTGYNPDEILGKNPNFLSSGKHTHHFYSEMWQQILTTGNWNGEIINLKKNGEEFVEWLRVSSAYKQDGSLHRRIAIFSDITQQKLIEEKLWFAANYDPITKLPNRNFFQAKLAEHIELSQRYNDGFSLLFLDLDKFKEVNDMYGHSCGDILLGKVANRITECVRKTDFVSRLGGDEFTVILTGLVNTIKISEIAQQILDSLSKSFDLGLPNNEKAFIACSIGITLYPADASTDMELIKNADKAMYHSKKNGRSQYCYFSSIYM